MNRTRGLAKNSFWKIVLTLGLLASLSFPGASGDLLSSQRQEANRPKIEQTIAGRPEAVAIAKIAACHSAPAAGRPEAFKFSRSYSPAPPVLAPRVLPCAGVRIVVILRKTCISHQSSDDPSLLS